MLQLFKYFHTLTVSLKTNQPAVGTLITMPRVYKYGRFEDTSKPVLFIMNLTASGTLGPLGPPTGRQPPIGSADRSPPPLLRTFRFKTTPSSQ